MSGPLPDATVRYADHPEAVVDLHLPASPTGRVLVHLHGGFWKAEWDRRHTRTFARALADAGWLVATPEYRRVRGGGGWPVTAQDVELAVRRLPDLLEGLGLPCASLTVSGHSAGGQLALWLATRGPTVAALDRLDRVVPLAPVADLREAIRLRLGDDAAQALLAGADPDEADPMTLLGERPGYVVEIVHGVEDDVVPPSLSRRLVDRHPWVRLHEVPGGHFEVVEPGSAAWPVVLAALGPVG